MLWRRPNSRRNLSRGLPAVLRKPLVHVAAIRSKRTDSNLGVRRKESHRRIRDIQARAGRARAVIAELETPILIVGAAGNPGDIDLIEIILSGSFETEIRP